MTSRNIFETANQITLIANQAELESREILWTSIIGLVFRRATRDIINPLGTTKLCAQLCGYLMQTSAGPGLDQFAKKRRLDQDIFWLCVKSLPPTSGSEVLVQDLVLTTPSGVQHPQGSTTSDGASSEYPPAERITFFMAELYCKKVLTASQVHEYAGRLITSGASTEECATGLCELLEQHGQTLDSGPWENAMNLAFKWIDVAATECLVGERIVTRLKVCRYPVQACVY